MQEILGFHVFLELCDLFLIFDLVVIQENVDVTKSLVQRGSLLCKRSIFKTGDLVAISVRTVAFLNLQNAVVDKRPEYYVR